MSELPPPTDDMDIFDNPNVDFAKLFGLFGQQIGGGSKPKDSAHSAAPAEPSTPVRGLRTRINPTPKALALYGPEAADRKRKNVEPEPDNEMPITIRPSKTKPTKPGPKTHTSSSNKNVNVPTTKKSDKKASQPKSQAAGKKSKAQNIRKDLKGKTRASKRKASLSSEDGSSSDTSGGSDSSSSESDQDSGSDSDSDSGSSSSDSESASSASPSPSTQTPRPTATRPTTTHPTTAYSAAAQSGTASTSTHNLIPQPNSKANPNNDSADSEPGVVPKLLTPQAGRPSAQRKAALNDGVLQLSRLVSSIAQETGFKPDRIIDEFLERNGRASNLWNIYQQYLPTHFNQEMLRLPEDERIREGDVIPTKVVRQLYELFKEQTSSDGSDLLRSWRRAEDLDDSNVSFRERDQSFHSWCSRAKKLMKEGAEIWSFDSTLIATGRVINQDQSLCQILYGGLAEGFFTQYFNIPESLIQGHFRTHVFYQASRLSVESIGAKIHGMPIDPSITPEQHQASTDDSKAGSSKQPDSTSKQPQEDEVRRSLDALLEPLHLLTSQKWKGLPAALASKKNMIVNWPADVGWPFETTKKKGIAGLSAEARKQWLAGIADSKYPIHLVPWPKEGSAANTPVIQLCPESPGAPPVCLFHDLTTRLKGVEVFRDANNRWLPKHQSNPPATQDNTKTSEPSPSSPPHEKHKDSLDVPITSPNPPSSPPNRPDHKTKGKKVNRDKTEPESSDDDDGAPPQKKRRTNPPTSRQKEEKVKKDKKDRKDRSKKKDRKKKVLSKSHISDTSEAEVDKASPAGPAGNVGSLVKEKHEAISESIPAVQISSATAVVKDLSPPPASLQVQDEGQKITPLPIAQANSANSNRAQVTHQFAPRSRSATVMSESAFSVASDAQSIHYQQPRNYPTEYPGAPQVVQYMHTPNLNVPGTRLVSQSQLHQLHSRAPSHDHLNHHHSHHIRNPHAILSGNGMGYIINHPNQQSANGYTINHPNQQGANGYGFNHPNQQGNPMLLVPGGFDNTWQAGSPNPPILDMQRARSPQWGGQQTLDNFDSTGSHVYGIGTLQLNNPHDDLGLRLQVDSRYPAGGMGGGMGGGMDGGIGGGIFGGTGGGVGIGGGGVNVGGSGGGMDRVREVEGMEGSASGSGVASGSTN